MDGYSASIGAMYCAREQHFFFFQAIIMMTMVILLAGSPTLSARLRNKRDRIFLLNMHYPIAGSISLSANKTVRTVFGAE